MKRPTNVAAPKKGEWSCPDKGWLKDFPTISAGMSDPWWDDGKPRETWTLTVRFEPDAVTLCLNDKGASQGLYTTGEDFLDALTLMETALAEGTASWRRWKK